MTEPLDTILAPAHLKAAADAQAALRARLLDRGCLLFGPGNNGRQAARRLQALAQGPRLHGFISDVAADQGREIEGLPVLSRQQALAQHGAGLPVVNCIYRADVTIAAVSGKLRAGGFADVIDLPSLYAAFGDGLPGFYGFGAVQRLAAGAVAIHRTDALLADDHSRQVFRGLLQQRLSLDFSLPRPVEGNIYFPPVVGERLRQSMNAPDPQRSFVFVDCGAYNGDTVRLFASWHPAASAHVVAIEPDAASFAKLQAVAAAVRVATGMTVSCIQAAVGSRSGRIGFASLDNEASHVSPDAETTVALVTVDDATAALGLQADYVKYDVEGFEAEALAGTRDTIARRAALAVSVYHRPEDLWEIALMLQHQQPGYDFYLREHGPDGMDTVLYALPKP